MLLNKERALAMMKEAKIDALVATQPENVTYMTNFEAWTVPGSFTYRGITMNRGFQAHGVLTSDGARALIIQSLSEATAAAAYGWQVDELYVYGHHFINVPDSYDPQMDEWEDVRRWVEINNNKSNYTVDAVTALIKFLKKQGITKGRVGVELANLAPNAEQQLRDELNQVEFIDSGELFARIRYVKTHDELERLRRAAIVNERALHEMMKAIKPGVTEIEMRRLYRTSIAQEEGDIDFFTCAGGLRAGIWAAPTNYAFKPGDHVVIDVGCRVNCYHADTGICGVLGEPTKKQKEMWKGLNEVWNAGVSILRPGLRPSQLFDAMADVQKKNFGFVGGYFAHSTGIECREGPFANRMPGAGQRLMDIGEDTPYETGMVILIEIPTPIVGIGCVHREETFLITERGCEPIIHTVRDLFSFST